MRKQASKASFNPCFNGTTSATRLTWERNWLSFSCFNPCFNGTTSATSIKKAQTLTSLYVSILVLMELPLQHYILFVLLRLLKLVSILVLMELPLQQILLGWFTLYGL